MPSASDIPIIPTLASCSPADARPQVPNTIVITGVTGAGKTTMAASLFADTSKHLTGKATGQLMLPGAIWLAADNQATAALVARGIVPQWVLDLRELQVQAKGDMSLALRWVHQLMIQARGQDAVGIVWDTVTSLGAMLEAYYVQGDGCPEGQKGKDTRGGWGLVGAKYRELYESAVVLGLRQVILAQPKTNSLEEAADDPKASEFARARAIAAGAPGNNLIVPAVSGTVFARLLNAQCSISGWLRSERVNGKRRQTWMPYGGDGAQGKCRYEGILAECEPADLAAQDRKILGLDK